MVPLAVREFGRIDAPADLLVSGNIDSEPETPKRALLADCKDSSIVSVLLAVDTLPSVSNFLRTYPGADCCPIAGTQSLVVFRLKSRPTPAET